jgi:hypothetical protein
MCMLVTTSDCTPTLLCLQAGRTFPIPVSMLAHFYAGAILSTFAWWLSNDLPYSAERMGRYVRMLLVETSPPVTNRK